MVNYTAIYPGATYLLDPSYNFMGYRVPLGQLGGTTSIQTANQLKEVSKMLNQGMKVTEVSVIDPNVFEMMPQDHLKEIHRLNKLTGAESTIHAPIIDPSGFTEQGWSEENRMATERQFEEFVKRSHDLDPDGNVPVTIHSSNQIPGVLMMPTSVIPKEKQKEYLTEEEIKSGVKEVTQRIIAVDRETGKMVPLDREVKYYPTKPEGEIRTPEKELESLNATHFYNQLSQLAFYKERGDEILKQYLPLVAGIQIKDEKDFKNLTPEQKAAYSQIKNAEVFLQNSYQNLQGLYNSAYKYSDEKGKTLLKGIAEKYKQDLIEGRQEMNDLGGLGVYSGAIQNLIQGMQEVNNETPPKLYETIDKFAQEKASKTLSEVAFKSWQQYKDKTPIISIENPPYGGAISSAEELKKLIEKTRGEFANKLKSEGKSETEAKTIAEKLIGATWDTSHISMIRRQGFDKEKLIQQAKTIAPMVKHVHYNDNFGTTHTDLPPGMGDVPMKEIMGELSKAGFKGKKVFEGGNFFQHFQKSPFPYTLESASSPMYMTGEGPFFNQLFGLFGSYYSGHGAINPPLYHSTWGSSYSAPLPMELGADMPGMQQSRFSGTPNQ